ncbi:hypothetical protein KI387_028530, partial [Taxus chinensis]
LLAQMMIPQLSAVEAPPQGDSSEAPKPPETNLVNWRQEDQHTTIIRVYKRRAMGEPTEVTNLYGPSSLFTDNTNKVAAVPNEKETKKSDSEGQLGSTNESRKRR